MIYEFMNILIAIHRKKLAEYKSFQDGKTTISSSLRVILIYVDSPFNFEKIFSASINIKDKILLNCVNEEFTTNCSEMRN